MKFKVLEDGGTVDSTGATLIKGMTLEGPLFVSKNGTEPNELVTKKYVDGLSYNIQAENVTRGTMSVDRFPELAGDLGKAEGSNLIVLKNSGVVPGEYPKVTVNSEGIITHGEGLSGTDIPGFSWDNVKDIPDTLDGYGITDGVSKVNGVVNGTLTVSAHPVNKSDAVTKKYLEDAVKNRRSEVFTGDIIPFAGEDTPEGYLRANGAILKKDEYPELYSVIGDKYNLGDIGVGDNHNLGDIGVGDNHNLGDMVIGSGKPWKQQYDINTGDGVIGTWTAAPSLPGGLSHSQAVVTKNRVYLLGGRVKSYEVTIYTAPINLDGTLGAWTTAPSLPGPLGVSQAVVTKNRVYLLGGHNGSAYVGTVYTAPINPDGTLGTWTTAPSLPGGLSHSQAVVTKNRVYLLGGYGSGWTATVYTAPINPDGTLGTWTTAPSLPGPLGSSQAVVTKNRVYLLGGYGSGYTDTVYTAPINEDGTLGTWTTAPSLPEPLAASQAVVTKNRVYLLGGYGSGYTDTVYTAPINPDGTLGTWTTAPSLPGPLAWSQAVVTKNRVYLLGGRISVSGWTATVYTAPLSGGSNDYSEYYDGTYELLLENFALPYTPDLDNQIKHFIKY